MTPPPLPPLPPFQVSGSGDGQAYAANLDMMVHHHRDSAGSVDVSGLEAAGGMAAEQHQDVFYQPEPRDGSKGDCFQWA